MKAISIVVPLVAFSLLAGCGGGGSNNATVNSLYAGHWAGPWTDSNGNSGTFDVVVGTDGKLTGAVVDTTQSISGSVTGSAANTGTVTATEVYPGIGTVGVTGTVSIGTNGHLAGVVQTSQGGTTTGTGNFDLVKQ